MKFFSRKFIYKYERKKVERKKCDNEKFIFEIEILGLLILVFGSIKKCLLFSIVKNSEIEIL